ncbi:hypothetical protein [Paenibacillus cremeus]|uniref:Alpha glucuronidase N-terminal domain-containing protein n=1 Tax=Paenibacillus cremeus TaxID=2163881 RepID=A0A559KGE2_9BACL|nr:hypothetical protein [Paenibacillus cremeus]TVY11168.1 hypothetical protein FPZ49_04870 [Paenibacillus cremeus]
MASALQTVDLTCAVVVCSTSASAHETKAITVLIEEIAKRTGVVLTTERSVNTDVRVPTIIVGTKASLEELMKSRLPHQELLDELPSPGAEGYRIVVGTPADQPPVVWVVGADARGVLFGVGHLLRKLQMTNGRIRLHAKLRISSTPALKLRGHQLGYRPKTNAYDAWSAEQFEQYIRELAIFGSNSIEILPPRTDDDPTSPHMKVPALDMMIRLSEIIDSYGLDVWIWYPNMASDYSDPETIEAELAEREDIFRKLPRIDHILIPSGDPGHIRLDEFFQWTERVAGLLRQYHPHAKLWFSPQHPQPTDEWVNGFIEGVNRKPEWLGGVAHGPWARKPLHELRELLDDAVAIRNYPDITHNFAAQFPIREWDLAFAMTHGRESINPRPVAMKQIHNRICGFTIGSLTYSEGIYDDVNKFIWGAQDWDPTADVAQTLRDYARFFIGDEYTEAVAGGILALERNWSGPLIANSGVEVTLRQWRDIEGAAPSAVLDNYRFQMGLLRAYYDAYIRRRLLYETDLELRAVEVLNNASELGALAAVEEAESILCAESESIAAQLRQACHDMAERLFHSIGAQSSVGTYQAIAWDRGAFMDDIDKPLNNAEWLLAHCHEVRHLADERSRLDVIRQAIRRTDPGPGGYYDNLGSPSSWERVVMRRSKEEDPAFEDTVFTAYCVHFLHLRENRKKEVGPVPLAWLTQLTTFYKAPLTLKYEHLDNDSDYILKVSYSGFMTARSGPMQLIANDRHVLAEGLRVNVPILQQEYFVPREAIRDGKLLLSWSTAPDRVGPYAAEVWLMRAGDSSANRTSLQAAPRLADIQRASFNGTMG